MSSPQWANDHVPLLEALGLPNIDRARRISITFEPGQPALAAVDYYLEGSSLAAAHIARRHYHIKASP